MLVKAMLSVFNVEYKFAEFAVLKGLQKTRLRISENAKKSPDRQGT